MNKVMNTTLEQIKSYNPCRASYVQLLHGLNKTKADSEPLEFRNIYNILCKSDLFWATKVLDKKIRVHVGALFADTVKHLNKDKRVHDCIEVCFRYARGEATSSELENAYAASVAASVATDKKYIAEGLNASAAYAADAAVKATCGDVMLASTYTTLASSYADAIFVYATYNPCTARAADISYANTLYNYTRDGLALIFLDYIEGTQTGTQMSSNEFKMSSNKFKEKLIN